MSKQLMLLFIMFIWLTACGVAPPPPAASVANPAIKAPVSESQVKADLTAVKVYAVDNVANMKTATAALRQTAQEYYEQIERIQRDQPDENPYQYYWDNQQAEVVELLARAKDQWLEANLHYELNEGIVAGVPSLAYYDTWIDAGPSVEEDPAEALDWQLELPDGRTLDRPGNFFHHLTEPVLWGTRSDFVGLAVDLDGDGAIEVGEAMPEANIFLGAATGLAEATVELDQAIADWNPTLENAFTALVTMIPTMNEYFEQWKLSVFVSGAASTQENFVAVSRLFDINGILNGLDLTYDHLQPVVEQANPELNAQIDTGLAELVSSVKELYEQDQNGKRFSPEDADILGSKAQDEATALAGQVAQAAALLNIPLAE